VNPSKRLRFLAAGMVCLGLSALPAAVVVSEIYYAPGPSEDMTFQYVELFNRGAQSLDIGGWKVTGSVSYTFPEGTVLRNGAYVVLCRNPSRVSENFHMNGVAKAVGPFTGRLPEEGGKIVLRNKRNSVIDCACYLPFAPWPEQAAEGGFSLVRICPQARGDLAGNWAAEKPTPGKDNSTFGCPPPAYEAPPVVINEIHYHPPGDQDGRGDFIELYNHSERLVELTGWRLAGAVSFVFTEGTILKPGGFAVVCSDPAFCEAVLGVEHVVGRFRGNLSNSGEAVFLLDPQGVVRDAVNYGSTDPWPAAPDGDGYSLERISPEWPGEDPANWSSCRPDRFERYTEIVAEGKASVSGQQFLQLWLEREGECLIDDLVLEDITDPQNPQIVLEDDFDQGMASWTITTRSVQGASGAVPGLGMDGSVALRVSAYRSCPHGCTRDQTVWRTTPALQSGRRYRLRFLWKPVRGSARLTATVTDTLRAESAVQGIHTGGRKNSVQAAYPRPALLGIGRDPQEPVSDDSPLITVTVRSPRKIVAAYIRPAGGRGSAADVALNDSGRNGDEAPGDGIWSALVPPLPDGSVFLFSVHFECEDGTVYTYPRPGEPSRWFGYFVSDTEKTAAVPIYTIIDPQLGVPQQAAVNSRWSCEAYRYAHFAFRGDVYPDVAVRFRGFTGCYLPKRHFKVRFNRDRLFQGLRKINLNSFYTDKAYFREPLAWLLLKEIGSLYCETSFVRLHINGQYWGLFLYLEHPDRRFLERNGLDPGGPLYKALMGKFGRGPCEWTPGFTQYASPEEYGKWWEEETAETGDFGPLASFIDGLHESDGSVEYLEDHLDVESVILFQVGQVAMKNFDSAAKNFFMYLNPANGLWYYFPWDLDLSFGKYFSRDAVGLGRPVGTLNDNMSCPTVTSQTGLYYAAEMTECGFPSNWLMFYFFRAGRGYFDRAYLIRLSDVLQEKYVPERFDSVLEFWRNLLAAEIQKDIEAWPRYPSNSTPLTPPDLDSNVEILREQIRCIRDEILGELPGAVRFHPRLRVTELMILPPLFEGRSEALQFVELYNPDKRPVEAGTWSLGGDISYRFPEGTVIPPHGTVVVARDPGAFERFYGLSPFGPFKGALREEGGVLRVYDSGEGGSYPAVVDYLPYRNAEEGWPELWRGYSVEFTKWEEERSDNDRGEFWQRSQAAGGSPGAQLSGEALFLRGDSNGNGRVEIADAVFELSFLFAGSSGPSCMDAADANNDGRVNVGDVIFTLGFLFGGGPPPPYPFPSCGPDTGPGLGCSRYTACSR